MVGPMIIPVPAELRALKVSTSGADLGKILALKMRKSATGVSWSPHLAPTEANRLGFALPVTQVTSAHTIKSKQVEGITEEGIDVVM